MAAAQARPVRPLRLIVPAPSGGSTDMLARALAEALRRRSGLLAVVENRPGASGAVATDALFAAPRDGSAVLLTPNALVTEVPYTIKPRYDPFQDLLPLAELASVGLVFVAHAELPVHSLRDMIAYVRARPGKTNFASFGAGTASHVKGLQLNKAAGLDMQHVGYKGSPPALLDVVGGQVPFMFDAIPTSLPHIRERRLKALAVTSPQRWPLLPEVPTFAELGYPDLTQTLASTVFAVSDVPNEAAMQLRGELLGALAEPGMLAGLKSMGLVPALNRRTVAELTQALRLEYEQTGAVLRSIQYSPST